MSEREKGAEVRRLNDLLQCHRQGGRVLITRGVQALGPSAVVSILEAVASFDAFDSDNDPYGERDCATLKVDGISVLWKIDYYDKLLSWGSEDPSDPLVTTHVLTVMLIEEY